MKSRLQKSAEIEKGKKLLDSAETLIFADFSQTPAEAVRALRHSLKEIGASFKVIKKRLLKIVLRDKGLDFDPRSIFDSQLATVFAPGEVNQSAALVYKFSKTNEHFKILGGYDVRNKLPLAAEKIEFIGKLPPREIILAQLVGMISVPLKKLMHVLAERGRKVAS